MKNKFILGALILLILFQISCSKDNQNEKYLFENNYTESTLNLNASNYSKNCSEINSQNRLALRTELPNHIYSIFNIYKDVLEDLERKKIYASSNSEYKEYVREIQVNILDSLITKELQVNFQYFALLEDLEQINVQYAKEYKIPIDSFKSYYDLQRIVLGQEVLKKVAELEREDNKRRSDTQIDLYIDAGALAGAAAISALTKTGPNSLPGKIAHKTIGQVAHGLKLSVHGKSMQKDAHFLTNTVFNLSNKLRSSEIGLKTSKAIYSQVKNQDLRNKLKYDILSSSKMQVRSQLKEATVYNTKDILNQKFDNRQNLEFFRSIEAKLPGKIGSFSDGILSVHFENVNEATKYNQELINRKTRLKTSVDMEL